MLCLCHTDHFQRTNSPRNMSRWARYNHLAAELMLPSLMISENPFVTFLVLPTSFHGFCPTSMFCSRKACKLQAVVAFHGRPFWGKLFQLCDLKIAPCPIQPRRCNMVQTHVINQTRVIYGIYVAWLSADELSFLQHLSTNFCAKCDEAGAVGWGNEHHTE